jgi:hypothetical protein
MMSYSTAYKSGQRAVLLDTTESTMMDEKERERERERDRSYIFD